MIGFGASGRNGGFTRANGIGCDLKETGMLTVDEFHAWAEEATASGERLEFLDRDEVRAEVHSPLWHAGLRGSPERCSVRSTGPIGAGADEREAFLLRTLDALGIGFDS